MTSTDIKIGMTGSTRPSSRVLKPPGGGHTNIFGEPEVAVNAPRPKYNQQNSSNLTACIGSMDANVAVEKLRDEITHTKPSSNEDNKSETKSNGTTNGTNNNNNNNGGGNVRSGRVPPGGYSSGGFW